jgi:hypothetical protein
MMKIFMNMDIPQFGALIGTLPLVGVTNAAIPLINKEFVEAKKAKLKL